MAIIRNLVVALVASTITVIATIIADVYGLRFEELVRLYPVESIFMLLFMFLSSAILFHFSGK